MTTHFSNMGEGSTLTNPIEEIQKNHPDTDTYKELETILRAADYLTLAEFAKQCRLYFLEPFHTSTSIFDPLEITKSIGITSVETSNHLFIPIPSPNESSFKSNIRILGWIDQLGSRTTTKEFVEPSSCSPKENSNTLFGPAEDILIHPPLAKVPIIAFISHPGVIYLPGFLTFGDQLILANECLRKFINPPNHSNISRLRSSFHDVKDCIQNLGMQQPVNKSVLTNICLPSSDVSFLLKKLRWVTLGYQYNWTSRTYDGYQKFPNSLRHLGIQIIEQLWTFLNKKLNENAETLEEGASREVLELLHAVVHGWISAKHQNVQDNTIEELKFLSSLTHLDNDEHDDFWYRPDSAILNIYGSNDRLRGHCDNVELNDSLPLISLSLGQPCIFMLGDVTKKSSNIIPMILRSGDVLILGGSSRLVYHGVPKLLCCHHDGKNGKQRKSTEFCDLFQSFRTLEFSETMLNLFDMDDDSTAETNVKNGTQSVRKDEVEQSFSQLVNLLRRHRFNLSMRQVLLRK